MSFFLVATGGFFGAISRFFLGNILPPADGKRFPAATFTVNLTGSFLLGMLLGIAPSESMVVLIGTGFLGAYTTFSTFSLETVQLARNRQWGMLTAFTSASYMLCFAGAYAGFLAGGFFFI